MTIPIHEPPHEPIPGAPGAVPEHEPDPEPNNPERRPDVPPLKITEPDRGPPAIVASGG